MSDFATFQEAAVNDPIVHGVATGRFPAESALLAMANRHKAMTDLMAELILIAPKKVRMPDGSIAIWRCPDEMIPEP